MWIATVISLLMVTLCTGSVSASALGQVAASTDRQRIIELFEDSLSRAYSFKGPDSLPDFSGLDDLYPAWDGGDPGGARRVWVEGQYLSQKVVFRVDSVFVTSPYSARVLGKKHLQSARRTEFLWWFHHTETDETITIYEAYVFRDAGGAWKIKSLKEI